MYRLLFLLFWGNFLGGFSVCLSAQPEMPIDALPSTGDTQLVAVDNLPERIDLSNTGNAQYWDLTALQSAFTYLNSVSGAEPDKINIRNAVAGQDFIFIKRAKQLELQEIIGPDPLELGLTVKIQYTPPFPQWNYPVKFGDSLDYSGSYHYVLPIEKIPVELRYTLPITPDSIRIRCTFSQKSNIDSWGTLALPDNTYEVLREQKTIAETFEIDIKTGSQRWQKITNVLTELWIPAYREQHFYLFHSPETNTAVAVVQMDKNNKKPASVVYQVVVPKQNMRQNNGRPDIYVYPNPAINEVRFEFSNLPASEYEFKIFNILGMIVRKEKYQLSGSKTIKMDVNNLNKGTYLYSLTNTRGKTIATRRLVVIRP